MADEVKIIEEKADALSVIDPQVVIARQYPRDVAKARAEIRYMIETTNFYEKVEYAIPRKDRDNQDRLITITGPTVYLAKELMKCLTNYRFEQGVNEIGPTGAVV